MWLCRYYYPGAATQRCLFPIRTPSILACLLVALLAALLSLVSGISHLLHLLTLHSAECSWEQPAPVLESWPQSSCLCISPTSLWQEGHLLYPGLACPQVESTFAQKSQNRSRCTPCFHPFSSPSHSATCCPASPASPSCCSSPAPRTTSPSGSGGTTGRA